MNLTTLQDEIGRLLNDPQHQRWSTDVLTTRINLAQTEIQGYTNAVKTSEQITPVVGQHNYTLNASTMDILYATKTLSTGDVKPLNFITRYELDYLYPNWQQWSNGEPICAYFDETSQTLYLEPAPDAANAISNGITVYETRVPTDLALSTDIPFDSTGSMIPYHMAIVHWVVAQCWMDNSDPESFKQSKFHKSGDMKDPGQYELQIKRINDQFDSSEAVPSHVMWKPQGGRAGYYSIPTKSYPLGGW